MPGIITIKDLKVSYNIGVPDAERATPQRLLLTVEMEHDFTAAARRDALDRTIDYHAVAQRLLSFGERRSWKLIETLSVEIAEMIIHDFHARRVSVEVKKFILPEAEYVSARAIRP
jgi:dihydroneopterin aldolase